MTESDFLRHELDMVLECGGHLLAQGKRSLQRPAQPYDASEVDVVYVSPQGERCPIGFLLADVYRAQMEGHRVSELIRDYGGEVRRALRFRDDFTSEQEVEHGQRLVWLGKVHDQVGPMGWRDDFIRAAASLAMRALIAETAEAGGVEEDARWLNDNPFATRVYQH